MELRLRTERKLRRLFLAAGGKPQRDSPHYFVLGHSNWFRGLADNMQEVVVPLKDLPSEVTSFTYPDSFTAMGLGPEFGLRYDPRPYHQQVYRIEELDDVTGRYGMPLDEPSKYEDYHQRPFETYIEVQLWAETPIQEFLARRPGQP
jgi:hypothetical protein